MDKNLLRNPPIIPSHPNPMNRFFTLLILALISSSIFAQGINLNQGSIKQKKYLQKIPYQNINGMLVVPVSIHGKTYNFVLDTGAPLAISDKLFKELNLQIITQTEVEDADGARKEMKMISLPELHLQGITFLNTPGFVHHEKSDDYFNLFECFEIDGIIGSNMLRNSVVQFDEPNKQISITDNFKKLATKGMVYKAQRMFLPDMQASPCFEIGLQMGEQRIIETVLFDTGDRGFYSMSTRCYNYIYEHEHAVINSIAESEGSFAWGAHGVFEKQKYLLLQVPELVLFINRTTFNDVVVTTTNAPNSRIGSKLLQYGKVTLDYKKKLFFYEPFENINTGELSKMPWAISPAFQNDKLVVGIIWDKALEQQINLGDEVLSVDGVDIQSMDLCEYVNFANSSSNNTSSNEELILELKDLNTGEIKKVAIKRLQLNE